MGFCIVSVVASGVVHWSRQHKLAYTPFVLLTPQHEHAQRQDMGACLDILTMRRMAGPSPRKGAHLSPKK